MGKSGSRDLTKSGTYVAGKAADARGGMGVSEDRVLNVVHTFDPFDDINPALPTKGNIP